ncbi:MAG: sugar ABC transporter permease [Firmicutes bacterium]|nr:sugar ABC transporter permease [Bacillota bacterium]
MVSRASTAEKLATGAGLSPSNKPSRLFSVAKRQDLIAGYLFVLPVILGILFWVLIPMVLSLYYSFTNNSIIGSYHFIGLENYKTLFQSPTFIQSLQVTFIYVFISVPLNLLVGLVIAVLLNQRVLGMRVFRTLFYLPVVVPPVAGTLLWNDMFSASQYGVVNSILLSLHLVKTPFPFFTEPSTAMFSFIVMGLWSAGGSMLIWLAGLKSVPVELYEAARVDGASSWKRFLLITIPLITPTIFFNMIMGMIGAFQTFTTSFVLGGVTGSPLGALDLINVYIYRHAFSYFQMGFASAAAWVLFAITFVFSLVLFLTSGRWVIYRGEVE